MLHVKMIQSSSDMPYLENGELTTTLYSRKTNLGGTIGTYDKPLTLNEIDIKKWGKICTNKDRKKYYETKKQKRNTIRYKHPY